MTKERERGKPELIVSTIQKDEAVPAAGTTSVACGQTLGGTESRCLLKEAFRWEAGR